MPCHILSLPRELLDYTFTFFDPVGIAAVAQTCRALGNVTGAQNVYLWRNLYIAHPFDDPRMHRPDAASSFDWHGVLTRRVCAERNKQDIRTLLDALVDSVRTAPPTGTEPSLDIIWAEKLVSDRAKLFEDEILPKPEQTDANSDAYDLKVDLALSDPAAEEKRMFVRACFPRCLRSEACAVAAARRRAARVFVYDMRNYVPAALWGPFTPGARAPSWAHIDALVSVVSANLRDYGPEWPTQYQPPALVHGAQTLCALAPEHCADLDWADIGGEWMRVVCFCDYRDLIRFNRDRCSPDFFHDDFEEATRLLRMRLFVTGIAEDEESADPARPALRFEGKMRGFDSHESLDRAVHGVVRVMPSGDVRWTSKVSTFEGEEQWSSEGIQLGRTGSAAGIIGVWTGAQHAAGDPAGPFWSFRASQKTSADKIQFPNIE